MANRFMLNYQIVDTEEKAKEICKKENSTGSYYKRKHHAAHYTPWNSNDGYHGFIVWYVGKTGICKA